MRNTATHTVPAYRRTQVRNATAITGVALVFVGVGTLARQPGLVLAGALGVVFAAYAARGEAPPARLAVDRRLSDGTPAPGEEVTVSVTVHNEGPARLYDLRLVDAVPDALHVVDGDARLATALQPGEEATLEYDVRATRGVHEWGDLRAVTRDHAGSTALVTAVDAETSLTSTPRLAAGAELPLRDLTTQYHGRLPTDVGGSGVEFYATREYRRGDPQRRVNWNRLAKTGELATLELREERAATVVLLVDARDEAYVAPPAGATETGTSGSEASDAGTTEAGTANGESARSERADSAVERSVTAAGQVFSALETGGDRVGVATISHADCWLPPGSGQDHAARARSLFATHPALSPTPPSEPFYPISWLRRFRRRIPTDAQVLCFSPLADDHVATAVRRLDAHGHLVTVVSPDVTAGGSTDASPGRRFARLERSARIADLRTAGIRVVEWSGSEPLSVAVATAQRRWRR